MGRVVEVRQEVNEIQNRHESRRQKVHLVDRPVVRLAVADAGLAFRSVQPAAMHLGRHLPAERFAVLHRGHDRPDPRSISPASALRGLLPFLLPLRRSGLVAMLVVPSRRRPAAPLDFRCQTRRFCRLHKLRRRLRLRVHALGLGLERQAARHLRLAPTRIAHAPAALLGTRLQTAAVQHHRRRPSRRLLVGSLQFGPAKLLHRFVTDLGPLLADPLAQPLQMRRTDLHIRQFPQVVTRLRERRRLARLTNRLR